MPRPAASSSITRHLTHCLVLAAGLCGLAACRPGQGAKPAADAPAARRPATSRVQQHIQQWLDTALHLDSTRLPDDWASKINLPVPLAQFYRNRRWQPAWCDDQGPTAAADSLIHYMARPEPYGLLPRFYDTAGLHRLAARISAPAPKTAALLAEWDIRFTQAVFHFSSHLRLGRLHHTTLQPVRHHQWIADTATTALGRALETRQWSRYVTGCQPAFGYYRALQQATARFVQRHDLSDTAAVAYADPGHDLPGAFGSMKRRLVQEGFLTDFADTLASAQQQEHLRNGLQKFQRSRGLPPTGRPDPATRRALAASPGELFGRLAYTLERLRWENFRDSAFLLVNLPAYQSYLYRSGEVLLQRRVIVGKPSSPTPVLSSAISYFVVAPEWNVPRSIAVKEMLPRIQRNTAFLVENHLVLLDAAGNAVDPHTVEWRRLHAGYFPYTIRQQSGCDNALGNLLFHFPNRYGFYLHDTPQRGLFSRAYRALSHSCIRLDDPTDLADYLLRRENHRQSITHALVEQCQAKRTRRQYTLRHALPIHIRYYTCGVEEGVLCFYPDVYRREANPKHTALAN